MGFKRNNGCLTSVSSTDALPSSGRNRSCGYSLAATSLAARAGAASISLAALGRFSAGKSASPSPEDSSVSRVCARERSLPSAAWSARGASDSSTSSCSR